MWRLRYMAQCEEWRFLKIIAGGPQVEFMGCNSILTMQLHTPTIEILYYLGERGRP